MDKSSYLGLVQNVALLLTLGLFINLVVSRKRTGKPWLFQLLLGLLVSGVGATLMLTPWILIPGIIFDTRSVLLSVSGLFFGAIPTVIAMGITTGFRIYQGGAGVWMGVGVILTSGTIGILWRHLRHKPLVTITGWELYIFGVGTHIVMLACTLLLPPNTAGKVLASIYLPVLAIYPLGTWLLGLLMTNYLRREEMANDLAASEARLKSLVEIAERIPETSRDFLDFAIEQAVRLTESKVGYIFLYSEARKEFVQNPRPYGGTANGQENNLTLDEGSTWGEAVRLRKPVIRNSFPDADPWMKELPDGHIPLRKFMVAPVFSDGQIVAVVGIANKATDYDEADVLQVTLLLDGVWKLMQWKRAEEEKRRNEQYYRLLFEQAADGIFVVDFGGNFVDINPNGCTMLGYTRDEMLQLNLRDVLIEEDTENEILLFDELKAGQSVIGEWIMRHKNGAPINLEISGKILPDGQIQGVTRNITDRKQAEIQLFAAQNELKQLLAISDQSRQALLSVVEDQKLGEEKINQLNLELEQRVRDRTAALETTNKELEAFSYSVSHDLRAPLRALDGFSGALLEDFQEQLGEKGQHYLERIQEASRRMGQLIEDLLNLSRVTRRELNRERLDLSALVKEVTDELARQNPDRHVEIDIAPNLVVQADPHLMKIVMENLLNNAYKFTCRQELARIKVDGKDQAGAQVYSVSDNGTGFDMAYAGKLFVPFQRLHSELEFPGTGIGLVTVHRIITRHGGHIWPEAAPDHGATFYFTLGGVR